MKNKPVFDLANKHPNETDEAYTARYFKEQAEYVASLTVIAEHHVAVIGSKTEKGGTVARASSNYHCDNLEVALVGDIVSYEDGSEARITSGAGFAHMVGNKPVAITGSHVSGGDRIVSNPIETMTHVLYEGEPIPEGFLVEGYPKLAA